MSNDYKPKFALPVIAPPTSAGSAAAHYKGLGVTVTAEPLLVRYGLKISVAPPAHAAVYAIYGGILTFIPAGQIIPSSNSQKAPEGGAVMLSVWPVDVDVQQSSSPAGTPPVARYLYLGLDDVGSAVDVAVKLVARSVLAEFWRRKQTAPVPEDITDLQDHYLAGVMTGAATVFVDGGMRIGNARSATSNVPTFTLEQLDGSVPKNYVSPVTSLRVGTRFDTTGAAGRWDGHPLLAAIASLPMPVSFHLRFSIWNPLAKGYAPISASTVNVIQTTAAGEAVLLSGKTDGTGVVHLSHPNLMQLKAGERNLHFTIDLKSSKLHFDSRTGALTRFPIALWSTRGWLAADNRTAGDYEDFGGQTVGTFATPAEFRVGVDLHLHFRRLDRYLSVQKQFPPGSHVQIHRKGAPGELLDLVVDAAGNLDTVIYLLPATAAGLPEDSERKIDRILLSPAPSTDHLIISVGYATALMEDGVPVPRARFDVALSELTQKQKDLAIEKKPCPTAPSLDQLHEDITVDGEHDSDAIFVLQCFEEMQTFLRLITGAEDDLAWNVYQDPPGLGLRFRPEGSTAVSAYFPATKSIAYERFKSTARDRSGTVFHELGHAVHAAILTAGGVNKPFHAEQHFARLLTNEGFAFTEGFAEFFAAMLVDPVSTIFGMYPDPKQSELDNPSFHWSEPFRGFDADPSHAPQTSLDYVETAGGRIPFTPARAELGYKVEGAVATAMYRLFNEHVVLRNSRADIRAISTKRTNGDCRVAAANPWLTADVRNRFNDLIWNPLLSLTTTSMEIPSVLVQRIKEAAKAKGNWLAVKETLNALHMAVEQPQVTAVSATGVPPNTLRAMIAYPGAVMEGSGFTRDMSVEFRNAQNKRAGTTINAVTDTKLTLTIPPLPIGVFDVAVTTLWGEQVMPALVKVVA